MTVPQTDTGRQVENTKALKRTVVKELSKLAPQLRKKVCPHVRVTAEEGRSDQGEATVYQKHRSLQRRKPMYRD